MASRDSMSRASGRLPRYDKAWLALGLTLALGPAISLSAQSTPVMARLPAAQGLKVPGGHPWIDYGRRCCAAWSRGDRYERRDRAKI